MIEQYKHIAIEGNIGAGKTTASKLLAEKLDARLILEQFENNPFLDLFYSDRARYAFQVELFFLADRYHQLSKNLLGDIFQEFTVYDYHFAKSAIFGQINLQKAEHELFLNLYRIMERFMPRPDIVIYLYQSIDRLVEQIGNRGRDYESGIPRDYLQLVDQGYISTFKEETHHPVVILHMDELESTTPEHVLAGILEVLSGDWPNGLSRYPYSS